MEPVTHKEICNAIRDYLFQSSEFPKTIIINPNLLRDILDIYRRGIYIVEDLPTIMGLKLAIDPDEERFRLMN
ncbi:MAG: hypothetical protein GWN01_05415 [Nitrosopumilaceae archaeon]|nr:hypothetical protein [Nitrosopumilaceae archaeon]NIU86784.1 hypothetical protein [Nitrosopumilaceae archaeon]NIX60984.1 hypothetical protein [Nitrosopumilaceae archaeon]